MTRIKALEGKIIRVSQAIRDVSLDTLTITQSADIARGKTDLPEELFDLLCMELGNPDLFFDLT